jgi:hypothetical protein
VDPCNLTPRAGSTWTPSRLPVRVELIFCMMQTASPTFLRVVGMSLFAAL